MTENLHYVLTFGASAIFAGVIGENAGAAVLITLTLLGAWAAMHDLFRNADEALLRHK